MRVAPDARARFGANGRDHGTHTDRPETRGGPGVLSTHRSPGTLSSPLSSRNPLVQQLRRLSRRRSSRLEEGRFVIDGPVLVAEALDAGVDLELAFVELDAPAPVPALAERLRTAGVTVHVLSPGVLAAAYIVKSLPLGALRWLVAIAVTYVAFSMLRAGLSKSTTGLVPQA